MQFKPPNGYRVPPMLVAWSIGVYTGKFSKIEEAASRGEKQAPIDTTISLICLTRART
jgi:hypothetical protein